MLWLCGACFFQRNMNLRFIVFRADHAPVYAAVAGMNRFQRIFFLFLPGKVIPEGEEEKPVRDVEYGCPDAGKNRAVSFIKIQALAADGIFGSISCIVRIFGFNKEPGNILKKRFYMLEEKGADSMAAVIFHDSEIIQKAAAFIRENGKEGIS